ncbi:amino acid ABC transporter ATP-binding protein [Xylanimonas allomyrinae]|uniref:Amino acid ABC transporter ATP-binding protein n=1 Tax=Xylanimonas allomyrinae TaxID=2509459 RepID=A0A4P6EKH8_9MICO|nr:amino acid ABC transporter ATP-binding protein [Xylanimonas allomyrinae]QAY63104.1 amino acid ABC transporter ATP-binding protein [Xylanimonas allomyrinae]
MTVPSAPGSAPLLTIEGLRKSYGDLLVLDGIDLTVERGQVLAVVGPSGCGKSTLLRCVNGLEATQGGTIRLGTQTITDPGTSWSRVRQRVGMVFQDYELFSHLTVLDNILLAPRAVQRRRRSEAAAEAEELLRRVGLHDKRDAYPRQLSGGQKQRIAIVRSLILHPELMLFDEVTAALDPEMVREVLDVVAELAADGMTMLIVTHEMAFARAVADQVVLLDAGRVAERAEPEQFFTRPRSERARAFLASLDFTPRKPVRA